MSSDERSLPSMGKAFLSSFFAAQQPEHQLLVLLALDAGTVVDGPLQDFQVLFPVHGVARKGPGAVQEVVGGLQAGLVQELLHGGGAHVVLPGNRLDGLAFVDVLDEDVRAFLCNAVLRRAACGFLAHLCGRGNEGSHGLRGNLVQYDGMVLLRYGSIRAGGDVLDESPGATAHDEDNKAFIPRCRRQDFRG